jgi:hypothetical protein
MLKNIILFLELFVFLVAVLVFSLLYGVTLPNLSYQNINIGELYIKYDKKLIVKSDSFEIVENNSTKKHKFIFDISLDMFNDRYFLDIKNFHYKNQNLILKTKVTLTQKQIDELLEFKIEDLELNDFSFDFDTNLKAIKTKTTYITYKDDHIYFRLKNPTLNNIKLEKSSLILKNISGNMSLDLDLYIQHTLDKKLLNIIKYYGVNLDIKQYYGVNDIYVKAIVPFDDTKVQVYVKVKSDDTKILYNNILVKSNNLLVEYKNGIVGITSTKGFVNIDKKDIYFNNLNLIYQNDIIDINSTKGYMVIKDKNISFNNLKVNYFEDIINIVSSNGDIKLYNQQINYKNLKAIYKNDILKIKLKTANTNVLDKYVTMQSVDIKLDKQYLNINTNITQDKNIFYIHSNIDINNSTSKGQIFVKNLVYKDILKIKNENTNYNLVYKDNIFKLYLPQAKITYDYHNDKHSIKIDDLNKYLRKISFLDTRINNKKPTKGYIKTFDNFKNTNIYIDNLYTNIDIDKFAKIKFDKEKEDTNESANVKIEIKNSVVGYDKRYLYFDKANIKIKDNKTHIDIFESSSHIKVNIVNKTINIIARQISANMINRLIKSQKLKGGYINLDLVGNHKVLNGYVKFHKNTVKNVRLVNNLIAFINTTPVLFNSLLALPVLYNAAQDGFDFNSYYIKKGNFEFNYNIKNKLLKINDLYTKGIMSDFKGDVQADFKKKTIKAKMDLIFLKDYSKVLGHIPVLSYILMGDDGNFLTSVNIQGSFEKQTFETNVLQDTVGGLFNIIKRTISIPLLPFIDEKEKNKE